MRQALEVTSKLGDASEEADVHRMMSIFLVTTPEPTDDIMRDARDSAEAAKVIFEELKDASGIASVAMINAYADVMSFELQEDPSALMESATEGLQKARELYKEADDPVGHSSALCMLCQFYLGMEDMENAIETAEENVDIFVQAGMRKAQASAMHYLAIVHLRTKDYDAAETEIRGAQKICKELGAKGMEANLMLLLTQVLVGRMSEEDIP